MPSGQMDALEHVHAVADNVQLQRVSVKEQKIDTIDFPPAASVTYMTWLESLYMI